MRLGRVAPLWLAALAAGAQAQAPVAGAPTLREAVESAWQRALEAAQARGQGMRAAAGEAVARGLLPAPPSVELSHRDEHWLERRPGAGRETEVAAALPLWLPGQRAARTAGAQAEVARARADEALARWQVAGQVREQAWRIVSARAELAQARAHHDALERVAGDVDRRVGAGDLARSDALAARSEAVAARSLVREAQRLLAELERQWQVAVALPVLPQGQIDEPVPADAAALSGHPQMLSAQRQLAYAQGQQAVVSADRRDPPELLLRYRRDAGGGDAASRNSVGVGVRIPFGGEVRNRPLEAAAAGTVLLAERQLELTRLQLASTLSQAEDAHATAQERVQADRERAALARERAALVQRAFDAGEYGLPELLRALAAAAAAQTDVERSQAAVGLARARLLQAQGILP
jgi:cobalt-zinc-cadmium efflux system outer membrane protein